MASLALFAIHRLASSLNRTRRVLDEYIHHDFLRASLIEGGGGGICHSEEYIEAVFKVQFWILVSLGVRKYLYTPSGLSTWVATSQYRGLLVYTVDNTKTGKKCQRTLHLFHG